MFLQAFEIILETFKTYFFHTMFWLCVPVCLEVRRFTSACKLYYQCRKLWENDNVEKDQTYIPNKHWFLSKIWNTFNIRWRLLCKLWKLRYPKSVEEQNFSLQETSASFMTRLKIEFRNFRSKLYVHIISKHFDCCLIRKCHVQPKICSLLPHEARRIFAVISKTLASQEKGESWVTLRGE